MLTSQTSDSGSAEEASAMVDDVDLAENAKSIPVGEVSQESVDCFLEGVLAYSRANEASLRRGQLLLFPEEAEKLNVLLKALDLSAWAFLEIPDTFHPPMPQKVRKGMAGSTSTKKSKRKSTATSSSAPKRKSTVSGTAPPVCISSSLKKDRASHLGEKETLAQKAARASQRQLKQLPDWARRLHRITVLLCQSEGVRPFAREPSPSDHDYAAIYEAIQPGLVPIGLFSVVSKLEQGGYQTPLEAFNDIYSVWISAYRIHPPGSPLWLQAYEASKSFLQQVANEPLRDDFTPIVSVEEEDYSGRTSTGTPKRRRTSSTADVDKLLQEFLEQHESTSPVKPGEAIRRLPSTGTSSSSWTGARTKKRSSSLGKRQVKGGQAALQVATLITDLERENFQEYLAQLQAHHHLMLYEAFRRSAVWRSVESGEVELDDAKTSPPVFRKMIAWCRSQLAVQLPPHRKPDAAPVTDGFMGSGKILPGLESAGGKLAAKSYLESRVPEPIHAKYSSSSSSSSASSSSSDDVSSDEEMAEATTGGPPQPIIGGS